MNGVKKPLGGENKGDALLRVQAEKLKAVIHSEWGTSMDNAQKLYEWDWTAWVSSVTAQQNSIDSMPVEIKGWLLCGFAMGSLSSSSVETKATCFDGFVRHKHWILESGTEHWCMGGHMCMFILICIDQSIKNISPSSNMPILKGLDDMLTSILCTAAITAYPEKSHQLLGRSYVQQSKTWHDRMALFLALLQEQDEKDDKQMTEEDMEDMTAVEACIFFHLQFMGSQSACWAFVVLLNKWTSFIAVKEDEHQHKDMLDVVTCGSRFHLDYDQTDSHPKTGGDAEAEAKDKDDTSNNKDVVKTWQQLKFVRISLRCELTIGSQYSKAKEQKEQKEQKEEKEEQQKQRPVDHVTEEGGAQAMMDDDHGKEQQTKEGKTDETDDVVEEKATESKVPLFNSIHIRNLMGDDKSLLLHGNPKLKTAVHTDESFSTLFKQAFDTAKSIEDKHAVMRALARPLLLPFGNVRQPIFGYLETQEDRKPIMDALMHVSYQQKQNVPLSGAFWSMLVWMTISELSDLTTYSKTSELLSQMTEQAFQLDSSWWHDQPGGKPGGKPVGKDLSDPLGAFFECPGWLNYVIQRLCDVGAKAERTEYVVLSINSILRILFLPLMRAFFVNKKKVPTIIGLLDAMHLKKNIEGSPVTIQRITEAMDFAMGTSVHVLKDWFNTKNFKKASLELRNHASADKKNEKVMMDNLVETFQKLIEFINSDDRKKNVESLIPVDVLYGGTQKKVFWKTLVLDNDIRAYAYRMSPCDKSTENKIMNELEDAMIWIERMGHHKRIPAVAELLSKKTSPPEVHQTRQQQQRRETTSQQVQADAIRAAAARSKAEESTGSSSAKGSGSSYSKGSGSSSKTTPSAPRTLVITMTNKRRR